ncbi:membrane protein [Microbacterium phage Zooman]|nr:membrane protein [Microbacterium phage Zooman]
MRYGENVEDISFYPFKSMWTEGQMLFLLLYTMVTVGMGMLVTTVFFSQFFLALFFALITLYFNYKLRRLQMRFEEIGES